MYIVKKLGRKTFQAAQLTHERFVDCRSLLWNIFVICICQTEHPLGRQNWDPFFENKVIRKFELSKNVKTKNYSPKLIFFIEKKIGRFRCVFLHRKLTLQVRFLHFLATMWKFSCTVVCPYLFGWALLSWRVNK